MRTSPGAKGPFRAQKGDIEMTHVQPTRAGTNAFLPAAFAALVMAAALAMAIIVTDLPSTPSIGAGDGDGVTIDQAVVDSGRAWEQQRRAQSGEGLPDR